MWSESHDNPAGSSVGPRRTLFLSGYVLMKKKWHRVLRHLLICFGSIAFSSLKQRQSTINFADIQLSSMCSTGFMVGVRLIQTASDEAYRFFFAQPSRWKLEFLDFPVSSGSFFCLLASRRESKRGEPIPTISVSELITVNRMLMHGK